QWASRGGSGGGGWWGRDGERAARGPGEEPTGAYALVREDRRGRAKPQRRRGARRACVNPRTTCGDAHRPGRSVLRQAEHALGQDVPQDLRRAGTDAAPAREQLVELPLALVGRPVRPRSDLPVPTEGV